MCSFTNTTVGPRTRVSRGNCSHALTYGCTQWPFDRVGHHKICVTQPRYPPMNPESNGICAANTSMANKIQNAKPKSPPHRAQCYRGARATFCHQNDEDPTQISRIYMGFCQTDLACKEDYDTEPLMGYISLKPFGATLSYASSNLSIYEQNATCIGM